MTNGKSGNWINAVIGYLLAYSRVDSNNYNKDNIYIVRISTLSLYITSK